MIIKKAAHDFLNKNKSLINSLINIFLAPQAHLILGIKFDSNGSVLVYSNELVHKYIFKVVIIQKLCGQK